jgi:thiol-disulfide isomerase/thioredoxin
MTKRWKLILAAAGLVLAVAVVADALRAVTPRGISNFTGKDLKGRPFSLAEHRGRHPIILTFFATWCGPCRMELPHFARMRKQYQDRGLQVVVVAEEPAAEIRADPSLRDLDVTWVPDSGEVLRAYGIHSFPHTFIFNAAGDPVKVFEGYSVSGVEQIEKLIAAQPATTSP